MGGHKIENYLQLLEVFIIRELKSRYKASILGFLWIILYPLITAIILNFIFGQFIRINTSNIPYFLFVLSGLVIWNSFQQSINLSKDSLIWNRELIVKSSFPKDVLPLSYVLSKIPDFIINLLILLFFCLLSGLELNITLLFIPFFMIPLFLFTAAISLLVSFTNAIFRDFGRITEFLLMILFYITPVVYPASFIPEKYRIIVLLNPLAVLIDSFRELLFHNKVQFEFFLPVILMSCFIFAFSLFLFKKFENKIPDLI